MPSVNDIVLTINRNLDLPGSKLYGVAVSALRENEKFPVVMDANGNGTDCGINDKYEIIGYHKINQMASRVDGKNGYGDSPGAVVNSYTMQLIVWQNRKKTKLYSDELLTLIQSAFPDQVTKGIKPFQSVRLQFNSAILNDMQVYNQEYQYDKPRLLPEHNLFLINYTLETAFEKGCFNTCIES
ncbi:MAG: hypothetical protein H0X41_14590 [Chitinophagaceae bacterium]|nr:hypothetical protein [Chitinophagaceae bacterium]